MSARFDVTYVPFVAEPRLFLAVLIRRRYTLRQTDASCPFLHGRLTKPVYFRIPPGYPQLRDKNKVYHWPGAVYGDNFGIFYIS